MTTLTYGRSKQREPLAPPSAGPVRAIAELPRRAGRYGVTVGEVVVAPVSVETIGDLRLKIGQSLDEALVARLWAASRATECYDKAAAALARKGRPRRDLERYLKQRDHAAHDISWACDRLAQLGLLDDAAFARAFVDGPARSRGYGTRRVVAELRRRGVESGLVDRVIGARGEDAAEVEQDALAAAAARRARSLRSLEPAVAQRRLTAWLVRRGFGPGAAVQAARRALAADE
ncbi:MAG: regulatory protein RecX [Gemmatimonadaceae bacterium]|nr:regulatory protein RecX [Gemmatimonadaceae bacterium]